MVLRNVRSHCRSICPLSYIAAVTAALVAAAAVNAPAPAPAQAGAKSSPFRPIEGVAQDERTPRFAGTLERAGDTPQPWTLRKTPRYAPGKTRDGAGTA